MSFENWLLFMAIWIAASIPFGPNAANCVSTTATHGFRRGLWCVVGVFAAANIYMLLAISGVATFMLANPALFEVLRWLGVAYLAWMGVSLLRSRGALDLEVIQSNFSRWKTTRRAFLISMSNPKAIFVWMAVFTQFIDSATPLSQQLVVLAPSALAVNIIVYTAYCALGLGVKRLFGGTRKRWFDRSTGILYLGFSMGLAAADLRKA